MADAQLGRPAHHTGASHLGMGQCNTAGYDVPRHTRHPVMANTLNCGAIDPGLAADQPSLGRPGNTGADTSRPGLGHRNTGTRHRVMANPCRGTRARTGHACRPGLGHRSGTRHPVMANPSPRTRAGYPHLGHPSPGARCPGLANPRRRPSTRANHRNLANRSTTGH